jgi:acylaminoacyl-peptidase
MAAEKFKDIVDSNRLCVEGGSHGGFLTGWLIAHPDYCKMWRAASLWNAVLDMTYMVASTDIPDWIFACCSNKDIKFDEYCLEDTQNFFKRSPISQVKNVQTPSLILVGDKDHRVTPH